MAQESATEASPSISTGTFSELCGAIASFSVKHHGTDSADSPLCASAIRVRQQNGLKGRASSVPTSSNSFKGIEVVPAYGHASICIVIAGLDPAIHLFKKMDTRVKPAYDET